MLLSPVELFNRVYVAAGYALGYLKPLDMSPPLPARYETAKNPFDRDPSFWTSTAKAPFIPTECRVEAPVTSLHIDAESHAAKPLQDVKASDYITPQKYLDGAEIPTYYSFQMNLIPQEDQIHGMHTHLEVDRRYVFARAK